MNGETPFGINFNNDSSKTKETQKTVKDLLQQFPQGFIQYNTLRHMFVLRVLVSSETALNNLEMKC